MICRQFLHLWVTASEVVDNAVGIGSVRPLSTPPARGKWTKDRNVFASDSFLEHTLFEMGSRCRELARCCTNRAQQNYWHHREDEEIEDRFIDDNNNNDYHY